MDDEKRLRIFLLCDGVFIFLRWRIVFGFSLIFSNPYIQVKKSGIGVEDEDVRGC